MNKIVHPGRVLRDLMKKENVMMVGAFNGLVGRILKAKGKYYLEIYVI